MNSYFYERNSRLSRSARYTNGSKNTLKLNMQRQRPIPIGNTKIQPSSSTSRRRRRIWSFHVLVLQRTTKKCTKTCNARAQLLFCSLNLLFGDVSVAVVVVVCLSSLVFNTCSSSMRLPILSFGIGLCSFVLFSDNVSRNSCIH